MAARKVPVPDYSWEKEHAPRASGGAWWAVVALFAVWVLFLVAMAVYRWVFTLQ